MRRRLCIALVLVTAIFPAGLSGAAVKRAQAATPEGITWYLLYEVAIQGQTPGGSFSRAGYVVLTSPVPSFGTSPNGQNPVEVAILSGHPSISPEIGSIHFASNTALYGLFGESTYSQAAIDVAYSYADFNAGAVVMEVDPLMAQAVAYRNAFNINSGIAASAFHIFGGQVQLQFVDGWRGVSGVISLQGSADLVLYPTPYVATINGALIAGGQL